MKYRTAKEADIIAISFTANSNPPQSSRLPPNTGPTIEPNEKNISVIAEPLSEIFVFVYLISSFSKSSYIVLITSGIIDGKMQPTKIPLRPRPTKVMVTLYERPPVR